MGSLVLPGIHSASGRLATVAANPSWLPAGPSTSTYLASIFTTPSAELTSGLLANTIDFGDWPVVPADVASLQGSGQSYYVTIPQGDHFYREVEFNLANNFWGCNMSFGNSACGLLIRQAWAHLVDKGSFVTTGPCVNHCVSLDNPIPQPIDPNTPISCGWDPYAASAASQNINGNCVVSANTGAGGIAYNCVAEGGTCPIGTASGSCFGSVCYRPWMRGDGTADFCAAANLLKQAIAPSATLNANCTFASLPAAVTTNPINFYVRQDPGRNDMGIGMAMSMCAIMMGQYVEGCTTTGGPNIVSSTTTFPAGSVLTVMVGPITTFPGFTTCVTKGSTCTPLNNWGMYTAGFQTGSAFDVMAVGYDSQFVSAPTGNTPNPCAATTSTSAAGDYQYICSQLYDAYATQVTAAPCSTPTVGANPVSGQHPSAITAVSFGACTTNGNYAISAGTVVTGATLPSAINVPITVTSVGNYAGGTISFTTSVSGPVLPAVTATTPANVALAAANPAGGVPDAYASSITTITVPVASTTGTDTVTVTASDGTTTNSIAITVIVTTTALVTAAPATRLAAPTAQYILQDVYGKGAFTIPVFSGISSIAYVAPQTVGGSNTACATTGSSCDTQGWLRVSNAKTANVDQFFNWINAWNACPVGGGVPCAPGSVERQGNSQSTTSLSPYIASTVWDFYILGNVYDSIYASNPYAGTQVFDWMTISHTFQSNGQLSYTPPAGTTVTLHNTLKHDDFWQDGPQVTAFDVAFTYNTLIKNGAFQASGLSAIISGITVLSKFQFDINLFAQGPFTQVAALTRWRMASSSAPVPLNARTLAPMVPLL